MGFLCFSAADLWHKGNLNVTCFFLMSLRAAMSSGASEGTLVTTPVPEENVNKAKGQHVKCIYANQAVCFSVVLWFALYITKAITITSREQRHPECSKIYVYKCSPSGQKSSHDVRPLTSVQHFINYKVTFACFYKTPKYYSMHSSKNI